MQIASLFSLYVSSDAIARRLAGIGIALRVFTRGSKLARQAGDILSGTAFPAELITSGEGRKFLLKRTALAILEPLQGHVRGCFSGLTKQSFKLLFFTHYRRSSE
jgi:hypothetical protein